MPKKSKKHALVLTTSVLVLVNLIPVLGVLFLDWSVYQLVLLFWTENLIVGSLLVTFLDQPLAALLVLVAAKILVDLAAHLREHRSAAQTVLAGEGSNQRDPEFPQWEQTDSKLGNDGAVAPAADQLVHALRGELHALEADHEHRRDRARRELGMIGAAALVLAGTLLVLTDLTLSGSLIVATVLAVFPALFKMQHWSECWQKKIHRQLLPVVCQHVGGMHCEPAMKRRFVLPFEKLELVSAQWNRSRFGPYFFGRHAGTDFEFGQVALSRRSGGKNSSSEELFNGLLFRIRLPFTVGDRLLVADKSTRSGMRHMVSVDLDDPHFHETFAAHVSQDHANPEGLARSVLDAEWRSALLAINQAESGGAGQHAAIQAAFMHDSLYLSLRRFSFEPVKRSGIYLQRPGRNFLQIPLKLFSEPDLQTDLRALVDDVLIANRIVDQLPRRG